MPAAVLPPVSSQFRVSVIIIVRNEAASIASCLKAIANNNYPIDRYEVIVIDDHSEDDTVAIVQELAIPNLKLHCLSEFDLSKYPNMYKKAGQHYGVLLAKFPIILQTDGDCICGAHWISTMTRQLQDYDLVTGPVHITSSNNLLSWWQTFENIAVMAASFAGIKLRKWHNANGGNMIYKRDLFLRYKKEANEEYASGDDLFLVNWAFRKGYTIGFASCRDAIIRTEAEQTFDGFFAQRLRWATKTKGYNSSGIQWVMGGLFLWHSLLLFLLIGSLIKPMVFSATLLIVFVAKCLGDYWIISAAAPFYGESYSIWKAPIFSMGHTLYVVFFGFCGLLMTQYKWKGRSVR